MSNTTSRFLVWLPSPMGDAILCTPALRAIRRHFQSSQITFLAAPAARRILSAGSFNDIWLEQKGLNYLTAAARLRGGAFTHAILFKNSIGSALAVFLAGIPARIGYAREGRSFLLTDTLSPPRLPDGRFKPLSMVDYYLAIPASLGADTADRSLELSIDPEDEHVVFAKLPEIAKPNSPNVILVPGGAFGPSKCWPAERFAKIADWLAENYDATVIISVDADTAETEIAQKICELAASKPINLAQRPLTLGQLKALFANADLVISNDTGPRHIAIALQRKIITLFGPNDPAWTETGCGNEIKIIGQAPCAPCARPRCKTTDHLCMQSITVEMVCDAAKKLLAESE